nr:MFS transporter [uncultured Moraxella sp.]
MKNQPNSITPTPSKIFVIMIIIAIILLAINMRSPIIGFGAVAHLVQADLDLSTKTIGMIGAIPMIAFATSSFIAPKISQKIGLETTLFIASVLLALGIFGRVWQLHFVGLLMGTVLLSLAISLGNVLVPAVIKKYFPNKISLVTGMYSLTLSVMAGVSAGIAMTLVGFKNWQFALGSWGVVSVLASFVWLFIVLNTQKNQQNFVKITETIAKNQNKISVWQMPMAWFISIFMGVQSLLYYTLASFLPSLLIDKGLSEQQAGNVGMYFQLMAFPSIVLLTKWVGRGGSLRLMAVLASVVNLLGVVGFGFLSNQLAWLWSVSAGFGCGIIFTLCLMLFTIKANNSEQTAELSGMAQSVGYSIAIFGPLLTGWLKDMSGGWMLPMMLLSVLMAINCGFAWLATQNKSLS